jgi:hypothetical protein
VDLPVGEPTTARHEPRVVRQLGQRDVFAQRVNEKWKARSKLGNEPFDIIRDGDRKSRNIVDVSTD